MSKTFNVLGKNVTFKDEEKLYIDIRNIFYCIEEIINTLKKYW